MTTKAPKTVQIITKIDDTTPEGSPPTAPPPPNPHPSILLLPAPKSANDKPSSPTQPIGTCAVSESSPPPKTSGEARKALLKFEETLADAITTLHRLTRPDVIELPPICESTARERYEQLTDEQKKLIWLASLHDKTYRKPINAPQFPVHTRYYTHHYAYIFRELVNEQLVFADWQLTPLSRAILENYTAIDRGAAHFGILTDCQKDPFIKREKKHQALAAQRRLAAQNRTKAKGAIQ